MSNLMNRFWDDDGGFLISIESVFVATILVLGLVVGLVSVRNAVNAELAELANSFLALSQGYTIDGQTGCCSETQGSQTIDTPGLVDEITCVENQIPSVIDQLPCP